MFAVSERERARRWRVEGREGREGASERETRGWWGWRERGREREIVRERDREREREERKSSPKAFPGKDFKPQRFEKDPHWKEKGVLSFGRMKGAVQCLNQNS